MAKLHFQLHLMGGTANGLLEYLYWFLVFHTMVFCYIMQCIRCIFSYNAPTPISVSGIRIEPHRKLMKSVQRPISCCFYYCGLLWWLVLCTVDKQSKRQSIFQRFYIEAKGKRQEVDADVMKREKYKQKVRQCWLIWQVAWRQFGSITVVDVLIAFASKWRAGDTCGERQWGGCCKH